jgi:hypothetical protein
VRTILIGGAVPLGWALLRVLDRSNAGYRANAWLEDALYRVLSGFPEAQWYAGRILHIGSASLGAAFGFALVLATFGLPLGFVSRMLARGRIRSGEPDPLDTARAWCQRHPWGTRLVLAVPALLHGLALGRYFAGWDHLPTWITLVPLLVGAPILYGTARAAQRLYVAPTLDEDAAAAKFTITDDEIRFDAVAVTREAKAAVATVAVVSVAMVVWVASLPLAHLFTDARLFSAIAAYVVGALGGAVVFQRASRVAVGIDGVRVYGTSRTRFFGYRDLDEVRLAGSDLHLVRNDRVVLTLQLHGEDTLRRDAVRERIAERIVAARDRRVAGAQRFVEGKSGAEVARVAMGGGDYRAPSITKEQLWQLVEGATTDGSSRAAAANALARTLEAPDRARLRVAAERCAEPRVRLALERLADGEWADAPVAAPRQAAAR